jgi:hypothetical protein
MACFNALSEKTEKSIGTKIFFGANIMSSLFLFEDIMYNFPQSQDKTMANKTMAKGRGKSTYSYLRGKHLFFPHLFCMLQTLNY